MNKCETCNHCVQKLSPTRIAYECIFFKNHGVQAFPFWHYLYEMNPDGSAQVDLNEPEEGNDCPTWTPKEE